MEVQSVSHNGGSSHVHPQITMCGEMKNNIGHICTLLSTLCAVCLHRNQGGFDGVCRALGGGGWIWDLVVCILRLHVRRNAKPHW